MLVYALHTSTCSYLLDAQGVCRRIGSVTGVIPRHIRACIGAQFVACLDLSVAGGLVGELRPGTMALFVKQTDQGMSLLRTSVIDRVDDWSQHSVASAEPKRKNKRRAKQRRVPPLLESAPAPAPRVAPVDLPKATVPPRATSVPPPPARFNAGSDSDLPFIPRPVPVPRGPASLRSLDLPRPTPAPALETASPSIPPPAPAPRPAPPRVYRASAPPPRLTSVRYDGEEATVTVMRRKAR